MERRFIWDYCISGLCPTRSILKEHDDEQRPETQ